MLGVMAAVSVIEALVIIGVAVAGVRAYHRIVTLVDDLGVHKVAPTVARVNAILDRVEDVTHKVADGAERLDDTAERVRANVRLKTSRVVGAIRGARVALETLLEDREPRTT